MSSNQSGPPDDYFNDLSRQPDLRQNALDSPPDRMENALNSEEPGLPKPKRIACVICRKRKLKCDGTKPSCGTCARLGHNCAYDEVRRKSGPKRGYVKELEARLAQVETQLKTKIHKKPTPNEPRIPVNNPPDTNSQPSAHDPNGALSQNGSLEEFMNGVPFETTIDNNSNISPPAGMMPDLTADFNHSSWDMIRLGLEEPLPTQEAVDELSETYFAHFHPTAPMIHQYRHRAAMSLAPHMRPPVCLRYAMWCLAASVSEKYYNHQEIFYRRARKYAESDEMKGQGEAYVTLAHAQCWVLLASYEFKMMYFPRAWASSGRASRLCIMMGFNRLDGIGLDVKQTIAPPRDWTDREERRRTFWMAYCVDRYASIGTGWPMSVDEKDIRTKMPASEEAFENSIPQQTQPLNVAMTSREVASLSPFAGVVLVAHYFGQNLTHLHRPGPNEQDDNLQGEFWKRHRKMDNALLTTALSLPTHLRLPAGVRNSNVVFLNMALHTATITLHQAAIFKAESNDLPTSIVEQSRTRCLLAAAEITTIMRLTSHLDVATMNPFVAFCVYVAARVFVQFLKRTPDDQETRASLEFLLSAMQALKRRNPLSESFLIQLGLDIEGTGLDILLHNPEMSSSMMKGTGVVPADFDSLKCSPLFDIRDPRITNSTGGNFPKKISGAFPATNDTIGSKSVSFHGGSTQFSLQNIDLPVREQRTPPQFWTQSNEDDSVNVGRVRAEPNVQGWSVDSSSALMTGFVGANGGFDTNMSENNSDEQRSSYPTPSTNHSSSNTSYSTPQEVESENSNSNMHGTVPKASQPSPKTNTAAAAPSPSFYSFVPTDEIGFPPSSTPGHRQDPVHLNEGSGDFAIPQAWQLGSTGDTPQALPGLSPGDSGWVQIMEGMMWDGTAMGQDLGQENGQWTGPAQSRT